MNRRMNGVRGALCLAVVLLGFSAAAQPADAQRRRPNNRRVYVVPVTRIEGRIQKPQAFYILQRSNLNFEGLELKNSFVPKIIKSVDKAPF